jgi:arsenite-transporting ATPase
VLFGGKGGVGKTTCAAARAIDAARAGRRVLLVSTDPAHSLGDALAVRLSSRPVLVAVGGSGRGALSAVELDAPRAFSRWLARHRHALGDALEHGTWLDRADVDALLGLSIPGIDELVGMLEIVRLADTITRPAPDLIVVDTAPTGHTLRLLASPDAVATVAGVLDALQDEHRAIRMHFARTTRADRADRLIELLLRQAGEARALLRDRSRTTFHWVMLPEALSLAETADAVAVLQAARLPLTTIVINRVLEPGPPCRLCDRRRREERRIVGRARRTVARNRALVLIRDVDREPSGVPLLATLERGKTPLVGRNSRRPKSRSRQGEADSAITGRLRLSIRAFDGARLVFFLGKGGVGKTTCAAAAAIALARARPNERVHLLSLDPAHSLGDVFDTPVGDAAVPVDSSARNLLVREFDASAALASRRAAIGAAFDEIAQAMGAGRLTDRYAGFDQLMALAPPGIDEVLGLVSMIEALASHTFGIVVVDAAPTGHALRLLETPDAAESWIHALIRMLLKYRQIVRPGRLAAELVALSKSIRSLRQLLRSRDRSRFVVVTRAAAVPRRETERLFEDLERLGVNVSIVVSNAMRLAQGGCQRCRTIAASERRQLGPLAGAARRAFRQCAIIQAPLVAPPPRGVEALQRWSHQWMT